VIAQWGLIFGGRDDDSGNIVGALAMTILAPVAAMLVQLAKLEGAAGAIKADVNPSTAHMFIVNPLKGRSIASLFSTHPCTPRSASEGSRPCRETVINGIINPECGPGP
jgi:heat shock protein HtpX